MWRVATLKPMERDALGAVILRGGVDLAVSGGFREPNERWEPELIEVIAVGVQAIAPVRLPPVSE